MKFKFFDEEKYDSVTLYSLVKTYLGAYSYAY